MIIMIKNGVALRQITLPSATSPLHQPQCHQLHQLQSDHHHHHRGTGHHYHHHHHQQQQQDDNLQDFQIKQHLKCHDHQPACHFCLLLPFCHICRFCHVFFHFSRFTTFAIFATFPFYQFCHFLKNICSLFKI